MTKSASYRSLCKIHSHRIHLEERRASRMTCRIDISRQYCAQGRNAWKMLSLFLGIAIWSNHPLFPAMGFTYVQQCTRNAMMIVYAGDLIKLSVNSMYVFGTTNESRSHLRAGLVGTSRSLPSRLRNVYRVHEYGGN